ncbi:MAG: aspartyl-phosphate phosphatase Spo0E family protein [Thermicanus sp.]|nr:aspartyl-phosphate phosphatase Spo0E family protein [Thermicanus sp.]
MAVVVPVEKEDQIKKEISLLRKSLYELSQQVDSLSHPDLVQLSQTLDQKLNQLGRIL